MSSFSFTERILWLRTRDWLKRYNPFIINIAGDLGRGLARVALEQVLLDERSVYAPSLNTCAPIDIMRAILSADGASSQNSWYRVLTGSLVKEIFEVEPDTLLLELAATRPGDIDWAANKLSGSMAVIISVGSSDLDLFHTKENVAHEITSLVSALPKDGIAILNGDDELVAQMAEHTRAQVYFFGANERSDVRALRLDRQGAGGYAGEIMIHNKRYGLHLPYMIARYQVNAILAAVTAAHVMGVDINKAISKLQSVRPPLGQLNVQQNGNGVCILDHTLDPSPESMMMDLNTLRAMSAQRRIAIIGEMFGLAGQADRWHRRIGKLAGEIAPVVIGVGEGMRVGLAEALRAGADTHYFAQAADVGKWLRGYLHTGDVILITGDPDLKMQAVVDRLLTS